MAKDCRSAFTLGQRDFGERVGFGPVGVLGDTDCVFL